MSKFENLVGKEFNRLKVIEYVGKTNHRVSVYICQCVCGQKVTVRADRLKAGIVKSCGCLQREIATAMQMKHGGSDTRLYVVYKDILSRCSNPNSPKFKNYGGRGIDICEKWRNSFAEFRDWAYANGYDENAPKGQCTIDRIDNNKGYSPDNCRWLTLKEQNNNRGNNIKFEINDKIFTLAQLAEMYGFSYSTLYSRVKKGWGIQKALSTPKS